MAGDSITPRLCWICGKAVPLERCKVDEHGLAVHEECSVARLLLRNESSEKLRAIQEKAHELLRRSEQLATKSKSLIEQDMETKKDGANNRPEN